MFFMSSFFVVAVFLWSNRVVIKIHIHEEANRPPTWSLGMSLSFVKFGAF
jgi:hypothetical protein